MEGPIIMRKLFLLYGAPGSGKSTLIKKLGVEDLMLGYDRMRELFSVPFPCSETDGSLSQVRRFASGVQQAVVKATHEALKARLAAGTTVFFDATMAKPKDQTSLARIGRDYGYDTYVIDVQGQTALEELRELNTHRGLGRVPDADLARMHSACAAKQFSPLIKYVLDGTQPVSALRREIENDLTAVPVLAAERVIVVGDVHSCAGALQDAIDELDAPGTQWVFAGDLFDRGPDPVGVWRIVHRLLGEHRARVVTGNHEVNLRAVNSHTSHDRFADSRDTRDLLLEAGIVAGEQTRFVDSTIPLLRVFSGPTRQEWIVTHGGVSADTIVGARSRSGLLHVSDAECIYGVGSREKTYQGKSSYDVEAMPVRGFQIHGHRNGVRGAEPTPTVRCDDQGDPVICLETDVASGGQLSAVVLDTRGYTVHSFDDHVDAATAAANQLPPWQRQKVVASVADLLAQMRASEHVNVKEVAGLPGVAACNFTRRAFNAGAWDETTMHARGLFIDTDTAEIVARGYEKFFHIGEVPGRTYAHWANPRISTYPVTLRKKYNGYLALVAGYRGDLVVFSKSGITDYSRFARDLLVAQIGADGAHKLAEMLERTKTTAAFEVIAARDTHPITEAGEDRLVLLDVIDNTVALSTRDELRAGVAKRFDFELAETVATCSTPWELSPALEAAKNRSDEGVVLVDAKGYRSKVKSEEYARRKQVRGAIERYWSAQAADLGPRNEELYSRLIDAGILQDINDYAVAGVDGRPRLDLARVFDDLAEFEADV